jgi:hypothetical protein
MAIVLDGTTGITNDGGYTGDGVVFADTTPANTLVTTTGGNVGIGTSSPAVKLHVVSSGAEQFRIEGTTASGYTSLNLYGTGRRYAVGVGNASETSLGLADKFYVYDSTAGATRMVIDSSGNLLVGTTTQLTSSRQTIVSGGNGVALQVGNGAVGSYVTNTSGTGNWQPFSFNNNGTSFSQIGSITCTASATAYNTSSDYRLKNTIAPMTGALAKVALLKPCTYKWNADGSDGEGFIAHELAEVCPQAVTGEKDAVDAEGKPIHQGIDTSFLVATLTSAIQEQQAIITALTARVEALEGTQP